MHRAILNIDGSVLRDLKTRSRRVIQGVLLLLVAALGAAVAAVAAVQPQGVVVDRWWPDPAGYTSLRADLTILNVTALTPYFWAHQFMIQGGDTGYIGLQSNENVATAVPGKSALFSIWNANAVTGPANGNCGTFGGEGEGYHCIDPYNWQVGHTYTLRISPGPADGQPGRWWSGWVLDNTTGVDTWLASIHVPGTGQLGTYSGTWTEYFGYLGSCAQQPYSRVRWGTLVANNGDLPYSNIRYYNGNPNNLLCTNGRMTAESGGAVLQEAGGTVQTPDPGSTVPTVTTTTTTTTTTSTATTTTTTTPTTTRTTTATTRTTTPTTTATTTRTTTTTPATTTVTSAVPSTPVMTTVTRGSLHLQAGAVEVTRLASHSRRRSLAMRISHDAAASPVTMTSVLTGPAGYRLRLRASRTLADARGRTIVVYTVTVLRPGRYTLATTFAGNDHWAPATVSRSVRVR